MFIIMSKTIEQQIEKSRMLITGFRRNINVLSDRGVTEAELNAMDVELRKLVEINAECDKLREELSVKVKNMNSILNVVKDSFFNYKKIIKQNYSQERWIDFGVADKR
ncbi:hypothetical protein ACU52_03020 [Xylanibacter rarus]|uniref:Uncharacterized protein n=3 Tax=Xylanibacter rarus TaxID=1676614 RepID=A0A8E1UQU5_9BACT|nr:hypothetical protein ACU52_03020 [Xylanibacter rarus]